MNYKRVERLYQQTNLQMRRRKRKKVLVGERQPLLRPTVANEVWSIDFIFYRTAEGRLIKCLVIVDDATHKALAIAVRRTEIERLEKGIQRRALGRADARPLCKTAGPQSRYDEPLTLNSPATEGGGTSLLAGLPS